MFDGAPKGAEANVTYLPLIETAKANGLEPYGYLLYLFSKLPLVQNKADFLKLPNCANQTDIDDFVMEVDA